MLNLSLSAICVRFFPGYSISSITKDDHNDITEIFLKMPLNTHEAYITLPRDQNQSLIILEEKKKPSKYNCNN